MKPVKTLVSALLLALSTTAVMADPIQDAVASEQRSAQAKLRDEYRHPQQTLRFFGLTPDMTVAEISPGGGWYTDILAGVVKDKGSLIAAHFYIDEKSSEYYRRARDKFAERITTDPLYKNVTLSTFDPIKATDFAAPNSVDMVLTFRNVHNWYMRHDSEGLKAAFASFFAALKPGGVLGVVEHELPESADDAMMKSSGYMKKSLVVKMAQEAGFTLAAESEVNHNPLDTADHPKGVWTLLPGLALKDENRDYYMSVGESHRMTLKFVKPQ